MDRKNNKNKIVKRIAMVLLCILIPVGAFGFGYFFKNVEGNKDVTHTLTVDGSIKGIDSQNVECDTDGIVPGDSVNVPISIQPNSTTESLLRVKVKPYWMSKDGTESDLSNKNLKVIDVNVSDTIIDNVPRRLMHDIRYLSVTPVSDMADTICNSHVLLHCYGS